MQRMLFLQVREKYQEENLKTESFLSCAFSCRLQTANQDRLFFSAVSEVPGSGSMGSWLSVLVNFWFSCNTIFLSSVNQLSGEQLALSHFIYTQNNNKFWNFRLHQISHVILSRYILGDRGIGGGVRENNANRFLLRING